jgi:Ca2+-binding RTX toxin-like protein
VPAPTALSAPNPIVTSPIVTSPIVPAASAPATLPPVSQPVVQAPIPTPAATVAVTLSGWNQSYIGADENHLVSGSQGSATISLGQGNNVVTASGWNNLISAGNGNNTISAGDGSETVTLGSGVNTVQSGGWNNTITVGSGQNAIVAGSGNETVNLAAGSDVVTLSGWTNLVTSNGGHAVVSGGAGNTYQIDAVGNAGGVDVTDFGTATNDVLDLSKLLANSSWNHQASSISNFLRVADTGGNTVVSFDASGSGAGFSVVATLGGSNFASLADMQNHAAVRLG